MKYKYLLIPLLFLSLNSHAQSWVWGAMGSSNSDTYVVSTDNTGSAYLAGPFISQISFGIYNLSSTSVENDAYLIKYDKTGNILWANQTVAIGTSSNASIACAASDNFGNEYIVGKTEGTERFGSFTVSTGRDEIFLVKYNKNGNVVWTQNSHGRVGPFYWYGSGFGMAVTADKAGTGNIYVAGNHTDTLILGTFILTEMTTVPVIAKYDSSGNVIWAKEAKTSAAKGSGTPNSVATDKTGNAYITGYFTDTLSFSSDTLKSVYNNMAGNVFLAKYNENGNLMWAKQGNIASAASCGTGYSVITDNASNIYITGYFHDTIAFGSYTLRSTSTSLYGDIFLVKYDTNGNVLWARQSTHTSFANVNGWSGYSLSSDSIGNIYMSAGGYFNSGKDKVIFGGDTFLYNATTNQKDPSLVLKLDTSGNVLCGMLVGTGGDDQNGIAVDLSGQYVYFGGDMWNSVVFGKDTLLDPYVPYSGNNEPPFIARWQPCQGGEQGINELETENKGAILFPNPNKGMFTIQSSGDNRKSLIEIYNMLGEQVYVAPLNPPVGGTSKTTISLPYGEGRGGAGIYLYRIISEEGTLVSSGKFVIQQ